MAPLSYHSSNLSLIALKTMWLLVRTLMIHKIVGKGGRLSLSVTTTSIHLLTLSHLFVALHLRSLPCVLHFVHIITRALLDEVFPVQGNNIWLNFELDFNWRCNATYYWSVTDKLWNWTRIDYHPGITIAAANQLS